MQKKGKKKNLPFCHFRFIVDMDSLVPTPTQDIFRLTQILLESFGLTEINEATALLTKINTSITKELPPRAIMVGETM